MRSMFGRQFALTAGLLLISMLLFGLVFRIFMFRYVEHDKEESLASNATAISQLAAAYNTRGELAADWNFRISLTFASRVADADAVICDENGTVILCSCNDFFCEHIGMTVSRDYVAKVIQSGRQNSTGKLQGLYEDQRYIVSVPIVTQTAGQAIGIVIASAAKAQISELLEQMTDVTVFSILAVLLVALIATSWMVRRQYRPLRDMADAARRFGHGDLNARVTTGGNTQEIDELAVAFNNMADLLQKSELQRQEFVANVSHELKTPMTTIAGFMDGMLDGTIPPERHRQYMQTVADEVRRLSRMVRSMLEISRLQSQGIPESRKASFDLCEAAGRTLVSFEQKIVAKQISVQAEFPDEPIHAFADADAITQVIYNLIDNAVKFCNPSGTLCVRVMPEEDKIYVSVSNTGMTIPEQELSLIFERFHKTDKSRSVDRDGVGLGLYIVRTIICSHGENISVTSLDGVTEFTFTLPYAPR